jgi:sodium-dependent dicarboxylate transporter 2/3/5
MTTRRMGYRLTDEPSEERFSHRATALRFLLGPAAGILLYLAPLPLAPDAHMLAAILACVVLYWIAEPIPLPMTALLGTAFCVLSGLGSVKAVFASFAHPIIFLFIGGFLLAEAMAVQGVDRRFATWILALPWVRARPSRILFATGLVTAVMSMWISNTAATALMLPIALGIIGTLEAAQLRGLRGYRTGLLLMLSYAATAGGVATIIGTPPNLIGIGMLAEQVNVKISFLTWLGFGLPLSVLMLVLSWALLRWLNPAETKSLPALHEYLHEQRRLLGRWSRGEINASMAFGVALLLWMGPGFMAAILGSQHAIPVWLGTHVPNELVALLAAGLLFFLPTNLKAGKFTLSWKQATDISWGTILLFGGGLAFGELMVKTGLSEVIGQGLVTMIGFNSVWGLTAIAIAVAVLISELASNTASASMLLPIVIAIAHSSGVSPVPPALGTCLGASLGFALPVSTPPNAIVYGTGFLAIGDMIRRGILFDVLGALLIWLTLRLLCPLLGLS